MLSRFIVAIIGVPIVYLCTWAQWQDHLLFAILVGVASTIALSELYTLARRWLPYTAAGLIVSVLMPLLAWDAGAVGIFTAFLLTAPLILIFAGISVDRKDAVSAIAVTYMGVAYVCVGAGMLILLRDTEHGFDLVLLMLAGTWLGDTGAYFGGRAIGRHRLAPRISPKKTVEGLLVGMAAAIAVVWFGHFLTGPGDGREHWLAASEALMLGCAIAVAAPVGDLFESMLKRAAGVKDTGNWLGEHGGMLDRIDALLLAAPATYVSAWYLGLT